MKFSKRNSFPFLLDKRFQVPNSRGLCFHVFALRRASHIQWVAGAFLVMQNGLGCSESTYLWSVANRWLWSFFNLLSPGIHNGRRAGQDHSGLTLEIHAVSCYSTSFTSCAALYEVAFVFPAWCHSSIMLSLLCNVRDIFWRSDK